MASPPKRPFPSEPKKAERGGAPAKRGLPLRYLGYAAVPIGIVVLLTVLAQRSAREENLLAVKTTLARDSLRTLNMALVMHASTYPECGFPDSLADLKYAGTPGPQQSGLLDPTLAQDNFTKSGYSFAYRLTGGKGDCQAEPGTNYELAARPLQYGSTGRWSFFTDQTGVIRATTEGREATADDPPLGSGTPQPPPAAE